MKLRSLILIRRNPVTASNAKKLVCKFLSAFLFFSISFPFQVKSQPPVKYDIFNRSPLTQFEVRMPQFPTFQPITLNNPTGLINPSLSSNAPSIGFNNVGNDIHEQNRRIMQQHDAIINRQRNEEILNEVKADLIEFDRNSKYNKWLEDSKFYRNAFQQLLQLSPDSFSLISAVYIVENAFLEGRYSFADFQSRLKLEANIIKQQLRNEKLSTTDNVSLNYGIQKRFRQGGNYYDAKKKQSFSVKPFKYDFEDFQGEKDYRQMFVTKMLVSGKGQCHSMPLMYLMIAEQLGAKAWLSLAPQHSFVRFMDNKGNLVNFETTNGSLVSTNWMHQSGYINATAIKNKTYLDTLSQKDLYAQCLADLLLGYLKKFDYDGFADQIKKRILSTNPQNMTGLMVEADIKRAIALNKINAVGRPPENELSKYPEAYQAYLEMHQVYERIDDLGFQDMPKEAYEKWLKTVEVEKKKQENIELQQRLQREMLRQKQPLPKSTVIDRTRG